MILSHRKARKMSKKEPGKQAKSENEEPSKQAKSERMLEVLGYGQWLLERGQITEDQYKAGQRAVSAW